MMKRSLDLASEMEIDLRGVLTWAFTFPGTAYFAGQRALATNGVHLPVLNAFKLLGRLRGRRLPVQSSGALPLEEVEPGAFRSRPDIDALASTDGSQLQILIWHYHDDLVPADPEPVTVAVQVPEWLGSRVRVRHQRVDEAHGDAFVVWQKQGSPASPSPAQRSELLAAMAKLELEPERTVRVVSGVASLAFELPRFAVSLLTLTPSAEPDPQLVSAKGGCAFALDAGPADGVATTAVLLALALVRGQRRAQKRRRRARPYLARRARQREPVEAQPAEHIRLNDYCAREHEPKTHRQLEEPYGFVASKSGCLDDKSLLSDGTDSHLTLSDVRCHRIDPSPRIYRPTSKIR